MMISSTGSCEITGSLTRHQLPQMLKAGFLFGRSCMLQALADQSDIMGRSQSTHKSLNFEQAIDHNLLLLTHGCCSQCCLQASLQTVGMYCKFTWTGLSLDKVAEDQC